MIRGDLDFEHLYSLTSRVTPLDSDCGLICGSACCRPNKENSLGVYLFPGEESMLAEDEGWFTREYHNPADYDFPGNWEKQVHFIKCSARCPRERRPLACRFFPLAPHLLSDGTLLIIHETARLPYKCPLITRKIPLRMDFTETVALAWQLLLTDPRIHRLVEEDSRERESKLRRIPPVVWAGS